MNRLKEQMIAHADPAPRQGERPRGHGKGPPGARGREKGLAGTEKPLPVPARRKNQGKELTLWEKRKGYEQDNDKQDPEDGGVL